MSSTPISQVTSASQVWWEFLEPVLLPNQTDQETDEHIYHILSIPCNAVNVARRDTRMKIAVSKATSQPIQRFLGRFDLMLRLSPLGHRCCFGTQFPVGQRPRAGQERLEHPTQ